MFDLCLRSEYSELPSFLFTMTRVLQFFFLLLVATLPLIAADPSDQFLSAYQSCQEGETLERSGNTSDALNKYRFAESLLLAISKSDPSWQKPVIEYRLKKTRESIDRLQGTATDAGNPDATLATPPVADTTPAPASKPEEAQGSKEGNPVAPSISITPPSVSSQSHSGTSGSASSSSESRRLRRMIEDLKGQLQDANDALTAQKNRATDLEHAEWAQKNSQLASDLDIAKRRISDLEHDLKSRDSWGQELKDLQKKLDDAVADKLVAEEQFQGSVKKLGDANSILIKQLQDAQSKVMTTAEAKQKLEQLTREVEQGKEVSAQLQAKLEHEETISQGILTKNDDLQKQLTETTEKLVVAQKQTSVVAPLQQKMKDLQAKVDQENDVISREPALRADLQVLQEDRDRLLQKVTALGAAAAEATKVKGLNAESETLKKTVADLKAQVTTANQEVTKARAEADASKQLAAAADKAAKNAQKLHEKNLNAAEADRAVLQEDQQRLLAKVKQASLLLETLKSTADSVPILDKDLDQLKSQMAENNKALDQSAAKLAVSQKAEATAREEAQKNEHASKNLADLLTQQNKSLQDQLQAALGKVASTVDHAPEAAALQDQVKKLQEQVDLNAKNFAESQRQLTEFAKAQPDQQKALDDKQKALTDAQTQAASLQSKLTDADQQILEFKKQEDQGSTRLKELQDQLADRDAKIAKQKEQKGTAVDDHVVQENDLLRGIVLREIKDEAKKAQAHRLMEEELKRLNVQSDTLTQQMALLAAPAVELSPEERSLFKDAQLVVSDQGGDSVNASISAPMVGAASTNGETGSNSVVSTNLLATNMPSVKSTESNAQTPLPWQGKFKELLSQAKEEFDRQDYLQAENTFQEALQLSPNDYFVLSNYGVVEFQLGKMKEAEEALKKATDQSSDNSFALTTLGIVYYRQHRPQDAEQVLRKALAINDNDFTAHNYLGIVLAASGKGKAGESELMKAVELNPSYADAHFNLAVIYATGKPPSKMLAKKHYQKALELGSPPDASLDRMLQ